MNSLKKGGVLVHKCSLSSCQLVSSQRRVALWRVFSNKVIQVFGHCWVDIPRIHTSEWESNWCCAICVSRGLIWQRICYLTLSSLMFLTNSVIVITEFLSSNHFQYQWIGKVKKTQKSNAPQTSFLCVKKSAAGKIFLWKIAPQTKLIKENAPQVRCFWLNPNGYCVLLM